MMELIPINGYVVIKEGKAIIEESASEKLGIILPSNVDSEPENQGKIIKLPPVDPMAEKVWFQEGDYVIFKRHMFDEIEVAKEKFLLGKIENVIAVMKPLEE